MSRASETLLSIILPKRSSEDESGLFTTVDEAIESSKRAAAEQNGRPPAEVAERDRTAPPFIADRI